MHLIISVVWAMFVFLSVFTHDYGVLVFLSRSTTVRAALYDGHVMNLFMFSRTPRPSGECQASL